MIKIFVEGSKSKGLGHIVRSLTIYDYFWKHQEEINVYADVDEMGHKYLTNNLIATNLIIASWQNLAYIKENIQKSDIVIIDSYHISYEAIELFKCQAKTCIIIDDLQRLNYQNLIILNPNQFGKEVQYEQSNIILAGGEFALVREAFLQKSKTTIAKKVKKELVSFGGTDVNNLTGKILAFLTRLPATFNIQVVIGAGATIPEFLKENNQEAIQFFHNINGEEMANLLGNCDFVISAAGQAINEIVLTKTPSALCAVVENQERNLNYLARQKGCITFTENDFQPIYSLFAYEIRKQIYDNLSNYNLQTTGAKELYNYLKER